MNQPTLYKRQPDAPRDPQAARMVGSLIGTEDFAILLALLPDEFYYLPETQQQQVWRLILAAVNSGERDLAALARVWQPTPSAPNAVPAPTIIRREGSDER